MSITVSQLERGGKLVRWNGGAVQIGAYPETIKDTMGGHAGVPDLFLLTESLFDKEAGVSAAELEFPLYYNFYLKKRKLRFVCRPHQLRPVLRVLSEALFGPRRVHHAAEYPEGAASPGFPDFRKEMAWFKVMPGSPRGKLQMRDVVTPFVLDAEGRIEVDGARIWARGGDHYRIEADGESKDVDFRQSLSEEITVHRPTTSVPTQLFKSPPFGVTVIGSGHGFDAAGDTSGFVIWCKRQGIMVDPPVNSINWLMRRGVKTHRCADLILTHCHADHDSGTLQKILDGGTTRVYTTPTVMESFRRKYRALTGMSEAEFMGLFEYLPVGIDQPVTIGGAEFRFKYRLHPIPTLGFECVFQDQSLVYSSDTFYDPDAIEKLQAEGVLSVSRARDLLDFPWHHDLILHEAGIPPIHTPLRVLAALPDEVKGRMYLTHVSQNAIPPESGLRLAPTGASQTLVVS